MIDNLIIARSNAYGLTQDAGILGDAIEVAGGRCAHVARTSAPLRSRLLRARLARHAFHIERAFPRWFPAAERHFLIPNQERFPRRHLSRLRGIDHVLAKTRHAQAIFEALDVPTTHVGFTSRDRRIEGTRKDNRILHLAGGNTLKGTEDILRLWARRPDWPELVLVQKRDNAPASTPANVTLHAGYLDEGTLRDLQNTCRIHICPSRSEGWGHTIVEAMACGALVITTDAPPMNEHVTSDVGMLVRHARDEPRHLGTSYFVDPSALEQAIDQALALPEAELTRRGAAARRAFERLNADFAVRIRDYIARPPATP